MTLSKALGQIGLQEGAIAFTCANPVPEIYPFEVKEAVDVAAQAIRDGVVKRPMDPESFLSGFGVVFPVYLARP